jgi:ABC-type transport system involved in multi-copper enzyme maturation permease subunit
MHSIWAVATNTIKQALRMKIAAVFIILLIVLLPVMGIAMTGDGTVKGRLQSFISYGLSLTSFLLCLLTIVVSVYSITSDIKQRQIYTVLTKPIRRFQFLFGKLLGVILLDVALLILFSALIYAITIYVPKLFRAGNAELAQLDNEFFTAWAGLTPAEVDVTKEVEEMFQRLEKTGQLPPGVSGNRRGRKNYIKALTQRVKLGKRAAAPGHELVWDFHNVKPLDPDQSLFVRFKYDVSVNPPDLQVVGRWFIGDDRQYPYRGEIFVRKDLIRTFCEIEVPADVVADDGYLAVAFLNDPQLNNTVVIFPPKDGLEVLYKADTFTANFIRAVLLILFRLIFLACLGMLASSFLSFPVAVLLCLVVFFTGTISGFCLESFDYLSANMSELYSYTLRPVIQLLPQFDKFDPAKFLVPARLLSWSLSAKVLGLMVCIKAVLLLLIALWIFSYREIAKITV